MDSAIGVPSVAFVVFPNRVIISEIASGTATISSAAGNRLVAT
jgi:hypothetical protein